MIGNQIMTIDLIVETNEINQMKRKRRIVMIRWKKKMIPLYNYQTVPVITTILQPRIMMEEEEGRRRNVIQ